MYSRHKGWLPCIQSLKPNKGASFLRRVSGLSLEPAGPSTPGTDSPAWCEHWRPIHKLHPDILLYMFDLQDFKVEDIIRCRRVDRWFYLITHHPNIWKRFLRRMNIPVATLRPSYSITDHDSESEAEQLVARAVSLDHNWRLPETFVHRWYRRPTAMHVNEIVFVEGGKYLVASVQDHNRYYISILSTDHPNIAAQVALAQIPTHSRASQIKTMYGQIDGKDGIVIVFQTGSWLSQVNHLKKNDTSDDGSEEDMVADSVCMDYQPFYEPEPDDREDTTRDPSDYFSPFADPEQPMMYSLTALFVNLETLEMVSSRNLNPGSEDFLRLVDKRLSRTKPFRRLVTLNSEWKFCSTVLFPRGENHTPHLAFYRNTNVSETWTEFVYIFDLSNPHKGSGISLFSCQARFTEKEGAEHLEWGILAMCPLPEQNQILIVRTVVRPPEEFTVGHAIEFYQIPDPGEEIDYLAPLDHVFIHSRYGHTAWITPTRSEWGNHPSLACRRGAPPPLSIWLRSDSPDQGALCHYTVSPVPEKYMDEKYPGKKLLRWVYNAEYIVLQTARVMVEEDGQPLCGYDRSIVYCRGLAEAHTLVQKLSALRRYFHPEFLGEGYTDALGKEFESESRKNLRKDDQLDKPRLDNPAKLYSTITLPPELDAQFRDEGVQAMAYDESIGRLILVPAEHQNELVVLDFCQYMPTMEEVETRRACFDHIRSQRYLSLV